MVRVQGTGWEWGAGVGGMEAGTERWGLWGCCGLGSWGGGPWGHNEPLSHGQAS